MANNPLSTTQTYLGTNRPIQFVSAGAGNAPAYNGAIDNPNFRYQDSGRPIQMVTPYTGAGAAALAPAVASPATAQPTDPVAKQMVRQQEIADAFKQQMSRIATTGQSALDQAVALSPKLTEVADSAYQAGLDAQNLDRYRTAVDTAAGERRSTMQQALDNLKSQAQTGFDASKRALDSQRAGMGLPTESTDFYRSLGDSYYRNFLPVEAQALAMQQQNVEQNLASEAALKQMEIAAAAQRAAASSQYANALTQPIGLQLNALGQVSNALASTAPLADRGFFNYLQGDDQLPNLPFQPSGYDLPPLYDPMADAMRAYGQNYGQNYGGAGNSGTNFNAFASGARDTIARMNAANKAANENYYGGEWGGVPFTNAPANPAYYQGDIPMNAPNVVRNQRARGELAQLAREAYARATPPVYTEPVSQASALDVQGAYNNVHQAVYNQAYNDAVGGEYFMSPAAAARAATTRTDYLLNPALYE